MSKNTERDSNKRLSLYPLSPKDALKALLETKPEKKSSHDGKSHPRPKPSKE